MTLTSIGLSDDSPGSGFSFFTPLPIYPFHLARAGVVGRVAVRLRVNADGSVEEAWVSESNVSAFNETVLQAVKGWRFIEIPSPFTGTKQGMLFDCVVEFTVL